jgi:hypothetical protein
MPDSLIALRDRREAVIARVSDCYAADILDVDELEQRLDAAHGARTLAELDAIVADLAPTSLAMTTSSTTSLAIDDPSRAAQKKLRVMLGSVERRGRWTVPRHLDLRCLWGSAELDFRDASIGSGITTIDVRITMANLEIIVPPWLAVDVDVSSFAGNVEARHRAPPEPDPTRPMLRIVGAVRFGNLEIVTRLPGETERDARKRERKARKQLTRGIGDEPQRALPPGNK